jgi:uracil-DNA glycosylase family 4
MSVADDIRACVRCSLHDKRKNAVPAEAGSQYQRGGIAIFAEAPGADEDALGRPMVGRAGKLMDDALKEAGLSRDVVVVLNRVRCRPPRNRLQDYPDSILSCDDWVKAELDEYDPRIVVLSGNTAMRSVFGATTNITSVRGTARATGVDFPYGSRVFVPCFHPAAALRNSELKQTIVDDLRLAKELWEAK